MKRVDADLVLWTKLLRKSTVVAYLLVSLLAWTLLCPSRGLAVESATNAVSAQAPAADVDTAQNPVKSSAKDSATESPMALAPDGSLDAKVDMGEKEQSSAEPSAEAQVSVAGAMAKMFLALMFVIGLMIAMAWLYKRWGKKYIQPQAKGRHLEVLDTISIGMKRQVSLLRVADQVLVIGSGEQEMTQLAQLPLTAFPEMLDMADRTADHAAPQLDQPTPSQQPASVHAFKQKLEAALQKKP